MKEKVMQAMLDKATCLVSQHIGVKIAACAVHGSMLRGFNDPNSDIDVCFLVDRPVSDYINMTNVPFYEGNIEDRRERLIKLSAAISRELGWQINISLLDMRSLLRGVMGSSTFALMAYENFSKSNPRIQFLFDAVADDYYRVENLVYRCGEQIGTGLRTYQLIPASSAEYKQERIYLGVLWNSHRLLAYLNGDRQHCRTIKELIELNRARWEEGMGEGFSKPVLGVIRARTERSPFMMPEGVSAEATNLLYDFTDKVLKHAAQYLSEHPKRLPTIAEETREMISLYQCLLDEQAQEPVRVVEKTETVAEEALSV